MDHVTNGRLLRSSKSTQVNMVVSGKSKLKADGELDNQGRRQNPPTLLERPIHKLLLLMPCDES